MSTRFGASIPLVVGRGRTHGFHLLGSSPPVVAVAGRSRDAMRGDAARPSRWCSKRANTNVTEAAVERLLCQKNDQSVVWQSGVTSNSGTHRNEAGPTWLCDATETSDLFSDISGIITCGVSCRQKKLRQNDSFTTTAMLSLIRGPLCGT